jgi:hypothetical protein
MLGEDSKELKGGSAPRGAKIFKELSVRKELGVSCVFGRDK